MPESRELLVLIVDDSPDDAELEAFALTDAGYRLTWRRVQNGDEMARALAEERWDVILCDHRLPRFDTFAALEVLADSAVQTPLIVVSGAIGEETAAAAIREGAADFVSKDRLGRLAAVVRTQLLDAQRRRDQQRAEAQFHSAFDDAPFGSALIALGDDAGRFLRANRALCEALGYAEAHLLERRLQTLLDLETRDEFEGVLSELGRGQAPAHRTEARLLDATGHGRWFTFSVSAVREPGGPSYAVAQFIQIELQRQAEEQTRIADGQLLEPSSRAGLTSTDELRAPLTAVIDLNTLLAGTDLSVEQREYVAGIRVASDALSARIDPNPRNPDAAPPSSDPERGDRSARILVAEHDAVNQLAISRLLARCGWHTDLAGSGREAIARAANRRYRAILVDCEMLDVDGYELTAELRKLKDSGSRAPVIALTADALKETRNRCLAAGMDDCVARPVTADSLELALQRATRSAVSGAARPV